MGTPAAFKATFSDFKLVKTRKVAQLIFELPLENFDLAYKVLGGMPNPADEQWFAIARLKKEPEEQAPKERKNWSDLSPSQQAAIRCNEATFDAFLREQHAETYVEANAAQTVRDLCLVSSRAELNTTQSSRVLWHQLDEQYLAWKAVEHA